MGRNGPENEKIKMKLLFAVLFTAVAVLIGVGIWLWTPDKSRRELEARYLGAQAICFG
jgi:hypothetical protein